MDSADPVSVRLLLNGLTSLALSVPRLFLLGLLAEIAKKKFIDKRKIFLYNTLVFQRKY